MSERIETRKYRITFTERLLGGAPMDADRYKWLMARDEEKMANFEEEELESLPDDPDKTLTGFHADVDGIYIMDYHIKGFLKESGNVMKHLLDAPSGKKGKTGGIPALKSKIDNYVFVSPRYIPVADEPAGIHERPLRAMTMQGPRVAIARSEYVDAGTEIDIEISLMKHPDLSMKIIEELLDYGRLKGLGQWRNGGFGRFTWERIDDGAKEAA